GRPQARGRRRSEVGARGPERRSHPVPLGGGIRREVHGDGQGLRWSDHHLVAPGRLRAFLSLTTTPCPQRCAPPPHGWMPPAFRSPPTGSCARCPPTTREPWRWPRSSAPRPPCAARGAPCP